MALRFDFNTEIESRILKQIDFALVRTFTATAKAGQEAVRDSLSRPGGFQLRNRFVYNSIRIQPATKANPTAAVYVPTDGPYNADFLVRQELGGVKEPTQGNKHLALPPPFGKGVLKPIVRRGKRPKDLLAITTHSSLKSGRTRQGYFKIDESTKPQYRHGMPPGIYQRKGKGGLKLVFAFLRQAPVRPRLQFGHTVLSTAKLAMPKLFQSALTDAVKTTK